MEDRKQAIPAKTYKVRLLRNYFVANGVKQLKGDTISLEDQAEANRLLKDGIAEKADARSFG